MKRGARIGTKRAVRVHSRKQTLKKVSRPRKCFDFVESFVLGENLVEAVGAATTATELTKKVEAKAGRSAYLEGESPKKEKLVDPRAWGVKLILEA